MKKGLFMAAALFVISGCDSLTYNMMTCPYKASYVTYEVQYKNDEVKGLTIVKEIDVTSLSDENFDLYVEEAENAADERNETDGIKEKVQRDDADKKIVTINTEIDYDEYDVERDVLNLFPIELHRDDFDNISTLRSKLNVNGFQCDELVEKNLK